MAKSGAKKRKIIFVCTGNICRSPMAEFLLKDYLKKNKITSVTVSSAGLSAGDEMSAEARAALAAGEEKLRLILEREEREKQKALRRKAMRKRICLACGAIAAAALVLWTVAYVNIIFPGRLDQAEGLIAQGRHEEAIALCLKSESVRKTLRGGELLYAARAGSAQAMRAEGRFEEAADLYALLGLTDKLDETYVQWSDALAAQGNAREAIRVLLLAQESEPREERLAALYMDRAEQAAQEAIVRGTQDTDYARESGKEIPTLDAQLRYCHALFDAGFDLLAVYPDGVKVEDAKLAQFQIDAPNAREAELDLDDALIFARTEIGGNNSIPWLTYTLTTFEAHDRTQDSLYTVRLLPGHMFREGASPVHSRAQADTVLLMDGVYAELGMVSVWDHLKLNDKDYMGIPVFMHYPYFGAISSVAAYDLRDPSRRQVFASETSLPLCSDEAWMAEHENDARTLSDLNVRMGTLNMQAMRSALDELLFGGKHAGRKDEAASTKEGRDANGTGA